MNVGFRIPSKVDTEVSERRFDLRPSLNFVWRNWIFIASVTALAFLIGVINLLRATPLYTASTQVLLEQPERAPGLDAAINDDRSANLYMENQLAILRSDSLLRRVVLKERLAVPPPSATESQGADVSKEQPALAEDQSIRNGINGLRGALAISQSGRAQVLNI